MRKNYKLVLGLVAVLTIGSAVGLTAQPTTTEAKIKFETAKEAGKRLYKAETTAYKSKKKVTRVFYVKANNEKKAEDLSYKIDCAARKAQYGKYFNDNHSRFGALDYTYTKSSVKKVKKGVYAYRVTLNGKNKNFRRDYRLTECDRKLLEDLLPLTEGKNQFDKAWITMAWMRTRAIYQCGKNQDSSEEALWKRKFHADCDDLAWTYVNYASCAGVKNVGSVSTYDHTWNYVVVDGRMYFIDFQGTSAMSGLNEETISIQKAVSMMSDPEFIEKNWSELRWLNKWYRENVDANAEKENNCKAVWDKMTEEQKEAVKKRLGSIPSWDMYQLTCDSYSKSNFEPLKVFCDHSNGDYTVKQVKKIVPKSLQKYLW